MRQIIDSVHGLWSAITMRYKNRVKQEDPYIAWMKCEESRAKDATQDIRRRMNVVERQYLGAKRT